MTEQRRDHEKELAKDGKDTGYPSYKDYKAEREEENAMLHFTITDSKGDIVRKLEVKPEAGVQRVQWDLRTAAKDPISLRPPSFYNPFAGKEEGNLVEPGKYTVTMALWKDDTLTQLGTPQTFTVKKLNNVTMPADDKDALAQFKAEVTELGRAVDGSVQAVGDIQEELNYMRKAIQKIEEPSAALMDDVRSIEEELRQIRTGLTGDAVAAKLDIYEPPSVAERVGALVFEQKYSSSAPTETHRASYAIAQEEFRPLLERLRTVAEQRMPALRQKLKEAGAPYTPNTLPEILHY